jgi:ABC-2 type transport system permease protein
MNAIAPTTVLPTPYIVPRGMSLAATLRIYFVEMQIELIRLTRMPAFILPTLLLPLMFYLVFGVAVHMGPPGTGQARYVLANFVVFGIMPPGLLGIGAMLANDRDRGLLELKRALPMPAGAYLTAKLVMSILLAAIITLSLMVMAATLGHVRIRPDQWAALLGIGVSGVLPFCALGLLIGTLVKGQAAPAVINLIYLPMSFLSGLWMPVKALPPVFGAIAPAWPSYHLARLTLPAVGDVPPADIGFHVACLVGMTIVFFTIARFRLRRKG